MKFHFNRAKVLGTFLIGGCLASSLTHAIEIAFEPDQRLPIVYINVAIKSGSVSDPENLQGLTNFMGRLMLRGTTQRTKDQIDLELDEMGGYLGVETRAESMIFRGSVLSENLPRFLSLLQEILAKPKFDDNEIRKLRNESVSELLTDLSSDRTVAQRWHQRFLFEKHPYGHLVEGTVATIKRIKKKDILTHFENLIKEKGILVAGTGNALNSQIKEFASQIRQARPGQTVATALTPPAPQDHARLILVDKPDRTQTQIYGGQVGITMLDPDYFPLTIGNHAFGGGSFQARLMVEIRVKKGWSYGAYSFFKHGSQPHSWSFWLFPASKYTPEALDQTLQMIKKVRAEGISKTEFDFAKNSLVNNSGFRTNTPQKRVENIIIERTLGLPSGFFRTFGERLASVKYEDVNRSLNKFLRPENLAVVVLGTNSEPFRETLAKASGVEKDKVVVVKYTE